MKSVIFAFFLLGSMLACSQNDKNIWRNYSEKLDNGYLIQFKYPSYLKFDRIENCLCLGVSSNVNEYNNTMEWGIWIDEPSNYIELDSLYFKEKFNNNFIIKKDYIIISNQKASRTVVKQSSGDKYYESILIKFNDCFIEVTNDKGESEDFKKFYESIVITR